RAVRVGGPYPLPRGGRPRGGAGSGRRSGEGGVSNAAAGRGPGPERGLLPQRRGAGRRAHRRSPSLTPRLLPPMASAAACSLWLDHAPPSETEARVLRRPGTGHAAARHGTRGLLRGGPRGGNAVLGTDPVLRDP